MKIIELKKCGPLCHYYTTQGELCPQVQEGNMYAFHTTCVLIHRCITCANNRRKTTTGFSYICSLPNKKEY
jgi:hypothetical protein